MIKLDWIRSTQGEWCSLFELDLSAEHFNDLSGVFMIWHAGERPETILIGSGNIRERLQGLKNDPRMYAHQRHGLFVTWAIAPAYRQPGMVAHLSRMLRPLMDESVSGQKPLEVSLPHDEPVATETAKAGVQDSSRPWV